MSLKGSSMAGLFMCVTVPPNAIGENGDGRSPGRFDPRPVFWLCSFSGWPVFCLQHLGSHQRPFQHGDNLGQFLIAHVGEERQVEHRAREPVGFLAANLARDPARGAALC